MTQLSTEGTQRILHKVLTLSLQWKNFSPCTQDCPVSGYIMAYLFEGDGDYTRWSACSYRVYAHKQGVADNACYIILHMPDPRSLIRTSPSTCQTLVP
jgi:hypothetical protein